MKNPNLASDMEIKSAQEVFKKIEIEFAKNIIGQKDMIKIFIISLLAEGHVLLEGVPGLGKTRAIKTISKIINATFKRIQFTPDLLPSDIIGNLIFNPRDGVYYTKQGPIFANFVLADEINRAPAKVQSALLEAMQEKQVTLGEKSYPLPQPFLVLATQNPIEHEGTYELPEAQIDRFLFKTVINYPDEQEEIEIMNLVENEKDMEVNTLFKLADIENIKTTYSKIFVSDQLKKYIKDIIFTTRYPIEKGVPELKEIIAYGGSPRASISFLKASKALALIKGRNYVIPEDIKEIKHDVLRHRLILTFEAQAENIKTEEIIDKIFDYVKVP